MSEQVKSIKDKEFESKPKPIEAGEIIGIVILASFALAAYVLLGSLGKEFDYWDLILPLVGALTIIAIIASDTNHPLIEGIQAWLVSFWPISAFFVVLNFAIFLVIAHGMGKAIELGPISS